MSDIFFTADQHFNHKKILQICRPMFQSIESMNEVIIQRWNEKVKREDTIYCLGDFAWKGEDGTSSDVGAIIRRLNGQKFLITGSHDSEAERYKKYWCQITPEKHIKVIITNPPVQDIYFITLSHCAHRVWEKSHYGAWHLYAHSHGNLPPWGKSFDCGVDAHDFYPWSMKEVIDKMETLGYNSNDLRYKNL